MLAIDISRQGNISIVHVAGSVDRSCSSQFGAAINEEIDQGGSHIVVDLTSVDQIDIEGLRELLLALKKLRRSSGDLRLAQAQDSVREALTASRLNEIFRIYESLTEAIASN